MPSGFLAFTNDVTGTSIWTVGYVIGQIPSNLLLTRVSPRWVIPSLELGWGLATICTSSVKSYKSLYALRFLVGLFEYVDVPRLYLLLVTSCWLGYRSGFYPGIHYLLGSWYTPREIGKRAMIFWLAGSVGTLFSGFLQAAAYTNLNGTHGYAGCMWSQSFSIFPFPAFGFEHFSRLPQVKRKQRKTATDW